MGRRPSLVKSRDGKPKESRPREGGQASSNKVAKRVAREVPEASGNKVAKPKRVARELPEAGSSKPKLVPRGAARAGQEAGRDAFRERRGRSGRGPHSRQAGRSAGRGSGRGGRTGVRGGYVFTFSNDRSSSSSSSKARSQSGQSKGRSSRKRSRSRSDRRKQLQLVRWDSGRKARAQLLIQLMEKDPEIARSQWSPKVLANAEQAADQLEKLVPPPPPPSGGSASLRRRAHQEASSLEVTNQVQRQLLTAGGLSSNELVLQCVSENRHKIRPLNAVTALVWIARISQVWITRMSAGEVSENLGSDERFLFLVGKLRALVPEMNGGMLSSSVWSMAKLGFRDEFLLSTVAEKAASNMAIFHPIHLMRLCWGYAWVRFHPPKLLEKLPINALIGHSTLPAVDLCTILWAFVEFGLLKANHVTFGKILDRLLYLLQQGMVRAKQAEEGGREAPAKASPVIHPSDLVRLVVAMIPCGGNSPQQSVSSDRLLVVAKVFMLNHWNLLAASDLCGLLWAYAKSSRWVEAAEMLEPLAASFVKELQEVSPDTFSAAVWALGVICTRGGVDLTKLITAAGPAIQQHALRSLPLLKVPEQLVELIWGLVTAGLDEDTQVLKHAVEPVQKLLHSSQRESEPDKPVGASVPLLGDRDSSPAALCCLLWSFAAQGLRHAQLFETIAELLVDHAKKLRWADLADALWACAVMDMDPGALATATAQRVVAEGSEVSSVDFADLVRVAWSLTLALDDYQLQVSSVRLLLPVQTLAGSLGSELEKEQPPWVWPLLQQVLTHHACFRDRQHTPWLELSTQRAQSLSRSRESKRLRKQVCSILADSGNVSEEAEAILAGGAVQQAGSARLPVDVALPLRKLALDAECQFFTMFDLEDKKIKPNAVARLRHVCLAREGWTLRLVPRSAFASGDSGAKLQELLKAHPRQC